MSPSGIGLIAYLGLENYEESQTTSSSPQPQFTYLQLCPNTINKQAKYLRVTEMFYKVEKNELWNLL